MNHSKLRILVVDDHPLVRHGLITAIDTQADLCVVAQAESTADARECLRTARPDVMVLDLNLKDGDGWTLIEQLSASGELPPTLVLSINDELVYGRRLLQTGAMGYLMKDAPVAEIFAAIRKVAAGEVAVSKLLSRELLRHVGNHAAANTRDELQALSDRELQVSMFLIDGMTIDEMAHLLSISAKTVSTYKGRLMKKLGARTTPQLVSLLSELRARRGVPVADAS